MKEGDYVLLSVCGEISRPVMQQREDVVRSVPGVDAPLLEEVAVPLLPLVEVSLLSGQNVGGVDRNKVVSVRPRVLVHEAEGVQQLVDWSHQVVLETVAEIEKLVSTIVVSQEINLCVITFTCSN